MAVYKSHYQKKKGSRKKMWRAVIRIDGLPPVSGCFDRKEQAEDWEQETKQKIKNGIFNFFAFKNQHSFLDLIAKMHANGVFKRQRSFKSAEAQYRYWEERFGGYALIRITPELVEEERKWLLEKTSSSGTKLAAASVNRYMAVLRSILAYAVKRLRWIPDNPCSYFEPAEGPAKSTKLLTVSELQQLLDACRQSRAPFLFCLVLLALTTGSRKGELLKLEWRDIDFEHRLATFRSTTTKTNRARSIALCPTVLEELKKLHAVRNPKKNKVFASKTLFGQLDPKKAWYSALKRAGIVDYRFHDLRHQFLSMAHAAGADPMVLAKSSGHLTVTMLEHYTRQDVNMTRKYSEKVSDLVLRDGGNESKKS